MVMHFLPVGVTMGQAAVAMGRTAVRVGQYIPLHTADLIHMAVGNHHLHLEVGIKDPLQTFRGHQTVTYLAGAAAVVIVDGLPAHAVGNRQPPVLFQKTGKDLDQPLGVREMGKRIVNYDPVEFAVKGYSSTSPQITCTFASAAYFSAAIFAISGEISIPVTEATSRSR